MIQALFAVMILGILNVQMAGVSITDLPPSQLMFLAVALVGSGMMVTPLVSVMKDAAPPRPEDDVDLSA